MPFKPRTRRNENKQKHQSGIQVTGKLSMTTRGFGFVSAENGGPDIFIPPDKMRGALHQDRVRVEAWESRKGLEGQVVKVLGRGLHTVIGTLQVRDNEAWLEVEDDRLPSVFDVTAPWPETVSPGQLVRAHIDAATERPTELPKVTVVESLSAKGRAEIELVKLKAHEGIEEEFDAEVLSEAAAFGDHVSDEEIAQREDLRAIDIVTIDPADARDHDDAVWAERTEHGGFRVVVAIADVSHYVREGTAIDAEALKRGCSIYLPDRAIPMLPRALSSNLASLVPNQDRLTLGVEVHLSAQGDINSFRYFEAVIRSKARLTYEGVAHALGLSSDLPPQPEALARIDLLTTLDQASRALRRKRLQRGSLEFDLPEAKLKLDPETFEPLDIYESRRDPGVRHAYNLIEELMLLANEVVAEDLASRKEPTVFRVHGPPDAKKIEVFAQVAEALGFPADPEMFEKPKMLSDFLKRVSQSPKAPTLHMLLLRAMQQAVYDITNIGHFGLAATHYVHFTSPIRRYPDLLVHRTVRAVVRHGKTAKRDKQLKMKATLSSQLERRAMILERSAVDLYRAIFMERHIGDSFEATISSVISAGFFCTIRAPFVDVFCSAEKLSHEAFELDELGLRLTGTQTGLSFEVGDKFTVEITDVSTTRRQVYGKPAGLDLPARPTNRPKSRKSIPPAAKTSKSKSTSTPRHPRDKSTKSKSSSRNTDNAQRRGGDQKSKRTKRTRG